MRRLVLLLIGVWLAGCAGLPQPSATPMPIRPTGPGLLQDVFKGTDRIAGWTSSGEARFYNPENLFDLVDGQADAFFAYEMQQVAVRRYENPDGKRMDVEVWQVAKPADAYGLFTAGLSGEPAAMGNEGDIETGLRLSFWQASFVVHVGARQKVEDSQLTSFATAIAEALPKGGARPALVDRLPVSGLQARRFVFFHKEISVQDQLWLGGKNALGLSLDTDCLLARYDVAGQAARLLIVAYPSAERAATGLAALQSAGVADLQVAKSQDKLLGAVFGKADAAAASRLLSQALADK
ncbi:MAG: DUF6599 family protein [Rudaea sp.]